MNIDWEKYFDHIVVLSAAKNKYRRSLLDKEFKRIGLTNYEYFYNIYNNLLSDKLYDKNPNRQCRLHGHYFIIKRAYELGWNSIWIMEDDIRFLKDELKIQTLLNEFVENKNSVNVYMFDYIFWKHSLNNISNDNEYFSAASYCLDRRGMKYFIYMMEHWPVINDTWFWFLLRKYKSFNGTYDYYGEDQYFLLDVSIPESEDILPINMKILSERLCIEVDESENGDVLSAYYKPQCKENEIDDSLYQLYRKN